MQCDGAKSTTQRSGTSVTMMIWFLWTKLWLLSDVNQNTASWLNGKISLLESDQRALVTISAVDYNGIILWR